MSFWARTKTETPGRSGLSLPAEGIALLIADQEVKMEKCLDGNFFETTVSDVKPGDKYEYRVFRHGAVIPITAILTDMPWSLGRTTDRFSGISTDTRFQTRTG